MNFKHLDRSGTHSVKLHKFRDDILPLWVADMDIESPSCVKEALQKRASHPIYGYTIYPDRYYQSIRNWLKKRFDLEIEINSIIPSYGVVPSINFSIEAFSNLKDGIIIQTPIYPPFISSVQKHRRELLENRLLYKDGEYYIDFEDFKVKAKKAKLFLLCSPHNPTGRVWNLDELNKIIKICQKENVLIISDEIHSDIVYNKKQIPISSIAPDISITLNAPSKTFNIAGLNTSYAIIPNKKLKKAYINEQRKAGLNDGNVFGIEALMSVYEDGEIWLNELKVYLQKNIEFVNNFLKDNNIPITTSKTEATFLIWLDCNGLKLTDKELEDFFINKAKLGLNTGISFGAAGEGFMRLNIATSKEILELAMVRLQNSYLRKK